MIRPDTPATKPPMVQPLMVWEKEKPLFSQLFGDRNQNDEFTLNLIIRSIRRTIPSRKITINIVMIPLYSANFNVIFALSEHQTALSLLTSTPARRSKYFT